MINDAVGWAVVRIGRRPPRLRSAVARTTDGGRRWLDISPWAGGPSPNSGRLAVDFRTAADAWVAASATSAAAGTPTVDVYHTADGGRDWRRTAVPTGFPDGTAVLPVAISFADAVHGWLMVQPEHTMNSEPGALLATADGGRTWTAVAATYGPGARRGSLPFGGSIAFDGATTGWLAGGLVSTLADLLYATHDGGRTWRPVRMAVPPGHTRQEMVIAPPTFSGVDGVLPVWFQGRAVTYIYVTADGGASWRYTLPAPGALPDVVATHDAVVVDGATVYRTTDGGRHWSTIQAGGVLPALLARRGASMEGVDFADSTLGWIYGTVPSRPSLAKSQWGTTSILPFTVRTTDGGRTWSRVNPVLAQGHPAPAG